MFNLLKHYDYIINYIKNIFNNKITPLHTIENNNINISNIPNIIISIEGNIGAGKTTLFNAIKNNSMFNMYHNKKIIFLNEPVDIWENFTDKSNKKNILELYYDDPKKYSFSFQILVLYTMYLQLKQAITENNNTIIICERSIETSYYVFCKMLYNDNLIENIEYQIYIKLFELFINDLNFKKINKIIYLNYTPEICMQRITNRNRKGENNIKMSYLYNCKYYYDEYIYKRFNIEDILIINENDENIIRQMSKIYFYIENII